MIPIAYPRAIYLTPILLLLHCVAASAQGVAFSASASASKVGLADQFQVTYTIQDAGDLREFNPGAFKDFKVLGGPYRSQNTSVQMMGNQMVQSTSSSFTFVLQAKHTGNIILPPAVVTDISGHSYKSNALQVDVVPGSMAAARPRQSLSGSIWDDDPFGGADPFAAMRQRQAALLQRMMQPPGRQQQQPAQPGVRQPAAASRADLDKDVFIRVDVDKKAVRLGEQVTAIYRLYSRIPMQVAISKLPSLNGFWTQDFDVPKRQKPVEEMVNGNRYQVFVLKKSALFPQQPGMLTLDAAEAEGSARVAVDNPAPRQAFNGSLMMSDPFFNDLFGEGRYEDVPVHLKSAPVRISVAELPAAGRPAGFTGAVGSFSLAAKMDKSSLTTDDVATITLTISGSGNLKLFDAPKISPPAGIDAFDPNILDTITGRTTTISGEKIVTYSIAPRNAGDYVIPPLSLAWYDPQSSSYKTASTTPFHLHVSPGKHTPVAAAIGGNGGSGDIRDHLLPAASRPLILSPLYWGMYALPLLLLLGVTFYRRRDAEEAADTALQRNRLANKVAQKRLSLAGAMLQKGNARGFYDEISKSIWLYLGDKLGIPLSALGKAAAMHAMGQRGVPTPVQQQIEKVLNECEMALYASSGSNHQMQQVFSEAASIITGLERTLRTS